MEKGQESRERRCSLIYNLAGKIPLAMHSSRDWRASKPDCLAWATLETLNAPDWQCTFRGPLRQNAVARILRIDPTFTIMWWEDLKKYGEGTIYFQILFFPNLLRIKLFFTESIFSFGSVILPYANLPLRNITDIY